MGFLRKKKSEPKVIEFKEPLTPGDYVDLGETKEVEEEVVEEIEEVKKPTKKVSQKVVTKEPTPTEPEKRKIQVVKELPMQPVRVVKMEDGTLVNLITIEEALTEFINEEE